MSFGTPAPGFLPADAGLEGSWNLKAGRKQNWLIVFRAKLHRAISKMRLLQWATYCRVDDLSFEGKSVQTLAAKVFGEPTRSGAWGEAAREGITDTSFKSNLQVHNCVLWKPILHDLWLFHRKGQEESEPELVGGGARPVLKQCCEKGEEKTDARVLRSR